MKNLILLLLSTMLLLVSCGGDDDTSNPNIDNDAFFRCKINNTDFERTGLLAYAVNWSSDVEFTVYGAGDVINEDGDKTTVYITFPQDLTEGSHDFQNDVIYAYVTELNETSYSTDNLGGTGTLNITSISSSMIEGSFMFTGVAFGDENDKIDITEGDFSVVVR